MHGGTSCSTWLAAFPGHMQDATTPPRCQAALLELMLHVQLPRTATPRASGDTQLVIWLTPRSEPDVRSFQGS
ncbi:hypothetical protein DY000_02042106 [Brassica cretica]|uniref:Uncharacterized protein n=1 Tax=Brassica cretica TaxID=69181 RepID=A0ABQ7BB95_BRACR|nr:hypothetical protein DY000_02042106 [Brassica cretica]